MESGSSFCSLRRRLPPRHVSSLRPFSKHFKTGILYLIYGPQAPDKEKKFAKKILFPKRKQPATAKAIIAPFPTNRLPEFISRSLDNSFFLSREIVPILYRSSELISLFPC